MKFKPTNAMRAAARKGIEAASSATRESLLAQAKRIVSGQQLSEEQVRTIAALATSGSLQNGEEMLLGGPAGAQWATACLVRARETVLGEYARRNEAAMTLLDEHDGGALMLELFTGDHKGETFAEDEDTGLIWAPVLRSGQMALRPGPGGQKINEPLTVVAGHSPDTARTIGLQDLVDSFDADAVQHVCIPTIHPKKDEDYITKNTGFIRGLKIVDSKKREGEKVLLAAHDFTEPEIKEKVKRGTIANRSCGILHDYTNTTTAETFSQVLDHVALTQRPWQRGMPAYGPNLTEDSLSDEIEVVSLVLSEQGDEPPVELADSVSDASWDGSASRFTDEQYARSCVLDKGSDVGTAKERYSLPVREPGGAVNRAAVHSAAGMISKVKGASAAAKKTAAKRIVSLYRGTLSEDPPDGLLSLAGMKSKNGTKMGEVLGETIFDDSSSRVDLDMEVVWEPEKGYSYMRGQLQRAIDEHRKANLPDGADRYGAPYYSIEDVMDGKALLTCSWGYADGVDAWVVPFTTGDDGDVVLAPFAEWVEADQVWVKDTSGPDEDDKEVQADLGLSDSDPLVRASRRRLQLSQEHQTPSLTGGTEMSIITLSEETLAKLTPDEREQYQRSRADAKKAALKERIDGLKAIGLTEERGYAPFLLAIERIYKDDDGNVAINLSEGESKGHRTASEVVDLLVAALPKGKDDLVLSEQGDVTASPITTRPANEPEGAEELSVAERAARAEAFLAEHAPGSLSLSTANGKGE